jgi:hypothetical protein
MTIDQILNLVFIAIAIFILVRRIYQYYKRNKRVSVKLSNLVTLKRRNISPLGISAELLRSLIYAKSEDEYKQLVTIHPELRKFDDVGMPMHEALSMLLISGQALGDSDNSEHIIMISEMQPGISSVVTENSEGKRIANLFEIPADILTQMAIIAPKDIQLCVAQSLQTALHHPEYLTAESYWMLAEMVSSPNTKEETKPKLARLHKALGICLEYGLDMGWILKIRENHHKTMV